MSEREHPIKELTDHMAGLIIRLSETEQQLEEQKKDWKNGRTNGTSTGKTRTTKLKSLKNNLKKRRTNWT